MRYVEGEDVIAEARREDMESDALEWRRDEERERTPKCIECRHCALVRKAVGERGATSTLPEARRFGVCLDPYDDPMLAVDAWQAACDGFESW